MEVTWKLGNTYLKIQDCESGWDFTILDLFIFINWCRIGRSNEIRYRNLQPFSGILLQNVEGC